MHISCAKSKEQLYSSLQVFSKELITVDCKNTKWLNLWPIFSQIESRRYRAVVFLPSFCPILPRCLYIQGYLTILVASNICCDRRLRFSDVHLKLNRERSLLARPEERGHRKDNWRLKTTLPVLPVCMRDQTKYV